MTFSPQLLVKRIGDAQVAPADTELNVGLGGAVEIRAAALMQVVLFDKCFCRFCLFGRKGAVERFHTV